MGSVWETGISLFFKNFTYAYRLSGEQNQILRLWETGKSLFLRILRSPRTKCSLCILLNLNEHGVPDMMSLWFEITYNTTFYHNPYEHNLRNLSSSEINWNFGIVLCFTTCRRKIIVTRNSTRICHHFRVFVKAGRK